MGVDAKLKTVAGRPKDVQLRISPDRFTSEDNGAAVHNAYYELLRVAGSELDVIITPTAKPKTPTPQELRNR